VNFYLAYVDPHAEVEVIRTHLKEFAYPCRALRDPTHALATRCGATVTPEAAVISRDHTLTYVGRVDDVYLELGQSRTEPTTHDLADAIEATLRGQKVSIRRTKAVGCLIADLK
jgi:hypothetical protein